jgi:hypothetical protein
MSPEGPLMETSTKKECSKRFGDPVPTFVITPWVARDVVAAATSLGAAVGTRCRYRAATPVVCGAAMDVPVMVLVAVLLVHHADVTFRPGANRSTHAPKLLPCVDDVTHLASDEVEAATVIAESTRAGETPHALTLSLPAATTVVMPAAIRSRTLSSNAWLVVSRPDASIAARLIFATAGVAWLPMTESIALSA